MTQQKTFLTLPPQHQNKQPGVESLMNPLPQYDNPYYKGSGKLKGKYVLITGEIVALEERYQLLLQKKGQISQLLI